MTEGRSYRAQLSTARTILAMGVIQLEEHAATGAHADRVDVLHKLKAFWTARVSQLEPLAKREAMHTAGIGTAFGV